jgi:predicted nucleic acid-binding Zn ribbon protein
MPTYQFSCKQCNTVYEELCSHDPKGKYKGVICPKCKSKSKTKLMSACSYQFSNPEGTDRWNSESSGHDYRFNHNLPKVLSERQRAEEAGKNPNPYNDINDIANNDAWGDVK